MKYLCFGCYDIRGVFPPPPGSNGIIELEENREIIYGAQWVTGKILSRKELDPSLRSGFRRRAHTPTERLKLRASGRLPRTRFRLG